MGFIIGLLVIGFGVYLGIKKSKKGAMIGLIIFGLLILVGSTGSPSNTPREVEDAAVGLIELDEEEEEVLEPQAPLTEVEVVEGIIAETMKLETNIEDHKGRILDIYIEDDYLMLQLVGDDNLTTDWVKRGMESKTIDTLPLIYDTLPQFSEIVVMWYLPLVDVKGHVSVDNVMTIAMTRDTSESVNWDNFITDNIQQVADRYWLHSALD